MSFSPPYTGNPELDTFLANLNPALNPPNPLNGGNAESIPSYTPVGTVITYGLRYLHVKYADDNLGTGLSNSPTGKLYLALFNSGSATESLNVADYDYVLISGGFGTTKFFWYTVPYAGGIDYRVDTAPPSEAFRIDPGIAIDLATQVTTNNLERRIAYSKSLSRSLANTPAIVQTLGNASFPLMNQWGGMEVWAGTQPVINAGEVGFISQGLYNPSTNYTSWEAPFIDDLRVGSLSAISANIGAITAGSLDAVAITGSDLTIGTSPALVPGANPTMTGSGLSVDPNGGFAVGNSATNIAFDPVSGMARINGFTTTIEVGTAGGVIAAGSSSGNLATFGPIAQQGRLLLISGGSINIDDPTLTVASARISCKVFLRDLFTLSAISILPDIAFIVPLAPQVFSGAGLANRVSVPITITGITAVLMQGGNYELVIRPVFEEYYNSSGNPVAKPNPNILSLGYTLTFAYQIRV